MDAKELATHLKVYQEVKEHAEESYAASKDDILKMLYFSIAKAMKFAISDIEYLMAPKFYVAEYNPEDYPGAMLDELLGPFDTLEQAKAECKSFYDRAEVWQVDFSGKLVLVANAHYDPDEDDYIWS